MLYIYIYIYIYIYKYNFRAQLLSEAIIEMDCNMGDLVMLNVAADIDEVLLLLLSYPLP